VTATLGNLYSPRFYRQENRHSATSGRTCVPLILDLLRPASVIDVGCGQGEWLAAFAECGIADYQGIDGDYVGDDQLLIRRERFMRHDLTRPLCLDRSYDLALSLEVGEHLPTAAAPTYVAGLTELAPAVVFSAAVPGQGGVHHINEQWPWFWKELFASHGYVQLDPFRQSIWKNPNVAVYYQHNLFLYVNPGIHRPLIDRVGVPDKYTELTLVRTTILQDLTRPGPLVDLWQRLGRKLKGLFGYGNPNSSPSASYETLQARQR
jgi:SAM-dependent methyltransferase